MFRFAHNNLNVLDLQRSLKFYADALNLHEVGGIDGGDEFKIVHLGDSFGSHHKLELKWIPNRTTPYDLGENVVHVAFTTKNFGAKISTCTDMTAHIQYRKLRRLGLDKFIDFMVTSEETGYEKPAPIMFNFALEKMNVRADEAAYFGDALDRDVEGAAKVGITPFWFVADRKFSGGDDFKKIFSYREAYKLFFGGI